MLTITAALAALGGYTVYARYHRKNTSRQPSGVNKSVAVEGNSPEKAFSSKAESPQNLSGKLMEGVSINEIYLHEITSLSDKFEPHGIIDVKSLGLMGHVCNKIVDNDYILSDIVRSPTKKSRIEAFQRAGPRARSHFNPLEVRAAIVTCGGLCPGLNNVIREIVHTLVYLYGVKAPVIGVR